MCPQRVTTGLTGVSKQTWHLNLESDEAEDEDEEDEDEEEDEEEDEGDDENEDESFDDWVEDGSTEWLDINDEDE